MKIARIFFALLILNFGSFAQEATEPVLATANDQTYTANDLPPADALALATLPAQTNDLRERLLEQQIVEMLLETEAAARKTIAARLVEIEVDKRLDQPSARQIQTIYDANREQIGGAALDDVRPQIVEFLQREQRGKLFGDYLSNLKIKYKAALLKDVNRKNLSPFEAVATVNGKIISAQSFEAKNRAALDDLPANVYEAARAAIEQIVFSNLLVAEARALNIDAGDLIAREVTDKANNSEYVGERLESMLRKRLFAKYGAKFFIKQVNERAQAISADDDPSLGDKTAPVTIVMFSDFQCSHCAATHPALLHVLDEFSPRQIRFVLRDFPLTAIHADAFRAALAADAAHAQGKYFQYVELLYANQASLDVASLKQFATKIGLDRKRFDADLDSEKFAAEIRNDIEDGKAYGINGTPTIFVNGVRIRRFSAENLRVAIEKALRK